MAYGRFGLVAALVLARQWTGAHAQDSSDEDASLPSAPSAENFLTRHSPQVSVIGKYVYIDGGHITQLVDDEPVLMRPVNHTLSIDLSQSWATEDVEIRQIPKSSPSHVLQAQFTDPNSDTFYIWGGYNLNKTESARERPSDFWKFKADGNGGGSWTNEVQRSNVFQGLQRVQAGAHVTTADSGFYFGGAATAPSNEDAHSPVPGYVRFNLTANDLDWRNVTDAPYSETGTLYGGTATWIPTFGPNGLIMLLGGQSGGIGNSGRVEYMRMDIVYFMDPVTGRWSSQSTSADKTDSFMFGGRDEERKGLGDIHILSLPGFVWTKVSADATPRGAMGCAVVGNRQMLTVGGVDLSLKFWDLWRTKDSFSQGLGIFDMSKLSWRDAHDVNAAGYESPETIQSWYTQGGLDNVKWASEEVRSLFAKANDDSSNPGSSSGSDASNESSSSTPTAAIAGGVVGGVAAVALAFGLFWFLRRRRRSADDGKEGVGRGDEKKPELPVRDGTGQNTSSGPAELATPGQAFELHGDSAKPELDNSPAATPVVHEK
ncbi:hypothetical protein F5X68DRAFT_274675 [Plectosphaerella plurivora]|uniref:Kelch repeat protein n=1 Tax=Plectosphaerella plurivora TaxID=936078 RepID=A0A9P9ADC5_9PEZI|nr:hypothetical protein F5X68DRAFT_274675 [Plectosphaerella plurivora]